MQICKKYVEIFKWTAAGEWFYELKIEEYEIYEIIFENQSKYFNSENNFHLMTKWFQTKKKWTK